MDRVLLRADAVLGDLSIWIDLGNFQDCCLECATDVIDRESVRGVCSEQCWTRWELRRLAGATPGSSELIAMLGEDPPLDVLLDLSRQARGWIEIRANFPAFYVRRLFQVAIPNKFRSSSVSGFVARTTSRFVARDVAT